MKLVQRLLAPLLALALVAASVLLALEVAWAAAGQPPLLVRWDRVYDGASDTTWSDPVVVGTAAGVTAAGLLLLLVALKPRRPARLRLVAGAAGIDAALTRKGLRTALREAAVRVDGVRSAKVRLRRRRARVTATSRLGSKEAAQGLRDQVQTAVAQRLEEIALVRSPKVRARVKARRRARTA